mmetsp:Transcript_6061/g.19043  ORF Transcript_6061/g.19043 Transcript_6061/m.19043 type:complete len:101 (+) Transcript_6061:2230-2532(+)
MYHTSHLKHLLAAINSVPNGDAATLHSAHRFVFTLTSPFDEGLSASIQFHIFHTVIPRFGCSRSSITEGEYLEIVSLPPQRQSSRWLSVQYFPLLATREG